LYKLGVNVEELDLEEVVYYVEVYNREQQKIEQQKRMEALCQKR